jgi:hypothetical protein
MGFACILRLLAGTRCNHNQSGKLRVAVRQTPRVTLAAKAYGVLLLLQPCRSGLFRCLLGFVMLPAAMCSAHSITTALLF